MWQIVAPTLPKELVVRVFVLVSGQGVQRHFRTSFSGTFLGNKSKLLALMNIKFPSLGLKDDECHEMSWINSTTLYFSGVNGSENSLETLLNRTDKLRGSYKGKSDFVTEPIPMHALQGMWDKMMEADGSAALLIMDPFGGKVNEIPKSRLPFPYRKGFIYNLQYRVNWGFKNDNITLENSSTKWLSELYEYMEPYVSKCPRGAYINYRDLDIGTNRQDGTSTYSEARQWGEKYFGANNFRKLARVKAQVDPQNFFCNDQSIPPLASLATNLGIHSVVLLVHVFFLVFKFVI